MTNKIPVGETIAQTYRFAFANYLNNLGVTWMPLSLMSLAAYFFMPPYFHMMTQMVSPPAGSDPDTIRQATVQNLQALISLAPYLCIMCVMALLGWASISAMVTREALGGRTGAAFSQFPFGKPMWRLVGAFLLLILLWILTYVAVLLVTIVGGVGLTLAAKSIGGTGTIVTGIIGVVLLLILFCAVIYVWARGTFFVVPATISEGHISIKSGWRLARGNFWRIFVVSFAIWLPLILLDLVFIYAVFGQEYFSLFNPLLPPEQKMAINQHIMNEMVSLFTQYGYVYFPIGLLVNVFILGLFCGLSAVAYRALKEGEAAQV